MRKDVIEIEVQLSHDADVVAACPVDRNDRFDGQLELVSDVDRAGIDRAGGAFQRTFAIITVASNDLVHQIHDRMPAIIKPAGYERWLGLEPEPHDLLITYPSEPMTMWPISTRVNKPENDDPSLLDRTGDPFDVWAPLKCEGRA